MRKTKEVFKTTGALRLTSVIMILVMAISLAACSSDKSPENEEQQSSDTAKIAEFKTVDLDGNEVTQDVFSEADITMINFWGTFCRPCVQEMPEIQKINAKYAGKAQVIGVPLDVNFDDADSAEYKNALKTLEWAEAEFKNIKPSGDIEKYMVNVQYVPTTIFVDSEGNIIGEPVVGAMTEEYRARIDEYLEQNAA